MEAPNSSSSVDEHFLVNGDWESMKFGGSIDRLPSLSHFGSESLSEIMNSFGLPENAHGGNDVCARILPSSIEHGREINFKGKKRKKFEECSGLQADSTLTSTHRILNVQYSIPDYVHVSEECQHLISRIFVSDPATRISVPEIQNHPWFLKNLPSDLREANMMSSEYEEPEQPMQSKDEIMQIITEATIPAFGMRGINQYFDDGLDIDDEMDDLESDSDLDDRSGEIVNAE